MKMQKGRRRSEARGQHSWSLSNVDLESINRGGRGFRSVGNGSWEGFVNLKFLSNTEDRDVDRIYANIASFSYCSLLKMSGTSTLSKLKISQVNVQVVWCLYFIKIMGGLGIVL